MRVPRLIPFGTIVTGLLVSGSIALAQALPAPSEALRALFPVAPGGLFLADGPMRTVRPVGMQLLTVHPVRFEPPPGQALFRYNNWCGVVLQWPDATPQAIVTIGTDRTEVLHCEGLLEFGPAPAPTPVARLALVYRTSTRNAPNIRTPVILAWDAAASQWRPDDTLATALENRQEPATLARIRSALGRPGR